MHPSVVSHLVVREVQFFNSIPARRVRERKHAIYSQTKLVEIEGVGLVEVAVALEQVLFEQPGVVD